MRIDVLRPPVGRDLLFIVGTKGMSMVKAALPWLSILMIFSIMITFTPLVSTVRPDRVLEPQIAQ